MASFLKNSSISSHFRSHPQRINNSFTLSRRELHVEPGKREKALLAEDPVLKRFKSHKETVRKLVRFGDFVAIVVVAGCCYEIYVRAAARRKEASKEKESA